MKTLAAKSLSFASSRAYALLLALSLLMAAPIGALAQASQDQREDQREERTALEDRATSFQAVTGPATEDVPGGTLLLAAYIAIWAATMFYLLRLARIGKRIDADLSALRESLPAEDDAAREGDV